MEPLPALIEHFQDLDDPRIERCKLHKLIDIVFIAICAVVSGAEGWKDIEAFAQVKQAWLRRYLELPNGLPSDDTFRRVIARIKPTQFEACLRRWIETVVENSHGELINIDGKTLRGSYDRHDERAAIHMVHAWAGANRLLLAQRKVSDKSNEITAIPELLDVLDLSGSLVTIDAMGTQRKIARQIVEQGGDYVLALKSNQGLLYEDVRTYFDEAQAHDFQGIVHDYYKETDGGHGRIEVRQCWCSDDVAWLPHRAKWKGLRSIVLVEARRIEGEKESLQRRFYIASVAAQAQRLAEAVRGHWGIENRLHWVLDMTFGEDASRIRRGDGAENFGLLRRVALNLLSQEQTVKASLKNKRKRAGWDNAYLEKVLRI